MRLNLEETAEEFRKKSEKINIKNIEVVIDKDKDKEKIKAYPVSNCFQNNNPNSSITIEADKESIRQVIVNLLDNALKFAFKRITIKIRIDKSKGEKEEETNHRQNENKKERELLPNSDNLMYIKVDVIDDGPGIDEEISSNMFSKFNTKSDKGTGLGLFISKNIIDAHGGIITAKNNYERKGAIISFRLPIHPRAKK